MSFRDVVENSWLDAVEGRTRAERADAYRGDLPLHKQLALRALDTVIFTAVHHQRMQDIRAMRAMGLEQLGAGAESAILRMGDVVLKCVRKSEELEESERQRLALRKQSDFAIMQEYFADAMLPQEITVDTHPFYNDRRVVITTQPYVDFDKLLVTSPDTRSDTLSIAPPAPLDELSNFLDKAWEVYGTHQLLPDTYGTDNVVKDKEGHLVLLDTQPISTNNIVIQQRIIAQLAALGKQVV